MSVFDWNYDDLHQLIHALPNNPEEALTVALDYKELLMFFAGLTLIINVTPCLAEDVERLAQRLDELMVHQWGEANDEDE